MCRRAGRLCVFVVFPSPDNSRVKLVLPPSKWYLITLHHVIIGLQPIVCMVVMILAGFYQLRKHLEKLTIVMQVLVSWVVRASRLVAAKTCTCAGDPETRAQGVFRFIIFPACRAGRTHFQPSVVWGSSSRRLQRAFSHFSARSSRRYLAELLFCNRQSDSCSTARRV